MCFRRRFRTWLKNFASIHDYIGLIYKIIEDDKQTELNMCYFDREQDFIMVEWVEDLLFQR